MPAHVYMRLGKYHEATERNQQAVEVDQRYLAGRNQTGEYADGYYTHNLHFLWASLAMEGRNVEAMQAARDLTETITTEEARKDRWKELYLPTPIFSMIRFGRWEELLRELPPPKGLRLMEGMWRLGRGLKAQKKLQAQTEGKDTDTFMTRAHIEIQEKLQHTSLDLWQQFSSSPIDTVDLDVIKMWAEAMRPRSIHDLKPMLMLCQSLLRDLASVHMEQLDQVQGDMQRSLDRQLEQARAEQQAREKVRSHPD
ncbi:MAG: hypothetical protein HC767_01765 [Akkermansiaceae bacterium]|nr:hypothetical protein [Akkermansiaceae bacterium]